MYSHQDRQQKQQVEGTILPLIRWYDQKHRQLPWRETRDAYAIWLSEIILQQTRIEAGTAYYLRFLQEAPTVEALASMAEDRLLKLWEGLGYYSRARNLQKAAKEIAAAYGGQLPREPGELQKLPGIGAYTAGAISSIAYGMPVPAVDGNVLRVYARVLGDEQDISRPETKRRLEELLSACWADHFGKKETGPSKETGGAKARMPQPAGDTPGNLNQAIMDLGATVCVPNGEPQCAQCPLQGCCEAHLQHRTGQLPVKSRAKERRIEERTVLVLRYRPQTEAPAAGKEASAAAESPKTLYYVQKRPKTGLLADLWELPNEVHHLSEEEAKQAILRCLPCCRRMELQALPKAKHVFSHIEWHMIGYLADVEPGCDHPCYDLDRCKWVTAEEIARDYSLPSAFQAYKPYLR